MNPQDPKTQLVSADFRDIDGLIASFKEALARLDIVIIDHPDFDGTDSYGFLLSTRRLTSEEIIQHWLVKGDIPEL